MTFPGIKTTPVKRFPDSKASLSCRLCDANVMCNGGYYSLLSENAKKLKICERISTLLTVEDDNLSVGPRIFRRIEKFEATVKEVANLKECYEQNIIPWKGEAINGEIARSKRCSSSQSTDSRV